MLENTPLLSGKHDVYDRFTPARKKIIVAVVSWTGLIPLFVAGSFIPSIPQIAKDLHSTGTVVNLAVSLSILTVSLSSLCWATYSGFYGRRPIYLSSLPFFCIGSLGVGCAQSIPTLMAFRILQAGGASAGMSVGSGAIADIYRLEERGTAMGIFFAACLLGPALAPLAGGVAAYYYTWRHMQFALFLSGILALALILLLLPETSHPGTRGIDKEHESGRYSKWVWLNPLSGLALLRSPNLMAVTLIGTVVLLTDYVLLIPLAYTIGVRYGITNEALIGAFFLPAGVGNLLGAPLAGRLSDRSIVYWRARRKGEWVPEDRLRVTMIGAVFLVPLSVLCSGVFTRFVPGTLGIVLNLICLFANGLGVDFVLSPSAAYNVDVVHSRSAEIMAANNGFRGILLAMITTVILPSINSIGVLSTNAICAALAWIGALLMWITIKYGDRMRAYIDVGYSTISTT
ncbi:MFS general substrate transporter [Schizopora paradoxa]|uniref:MFS general substrate transporter n=1 Tax=Schizopora paradoxa TaxID=27342 RepID=A0A0H2S655_9AGAM|nr:MFS general substrate transporter [Schizopora paradoxa]